MILTSHFISFCFYTPGWKSNLQKRRHHCGQSQIWRKITVPQFSVNSAVTPRRCFGFRAIKSCVPCCHCTRIFTNTFSFYAFILFLDVYVYLLFFFFFSPPRRRTGKEEFVSTKQCVCKIFVEVFLSFCPRLKRLSLPSLLSPLRVHWLPDSLSSRNFSWSNRWLPVCVSVCARARACARQSGHLKCVTAESATSVNVVLNGGFQIVQSGGVHAQELR